MRFEVLPRFLPWTRCSRLSAPLSGVGRLDLSKGLRACLEEPLLRGFQSQRPLLFADRPAFEQRTDSGLRRPGLPAKDLQVAPADLPVCRRQSLRKSEGQQRVIVVKPFQKTVPIRSALHRQRQTALIEEPKREWKRLAWAEAPPAHKIRIFGLLVKPVESRNPKAVRLKG